MVCMWLMMFSLGHIRPVTARYPVLFMLALPFPTFQAARLIRWPAGRVPRSRLPHLSHGQWEIPGDTFVEGAPPGEKGPVAAGPCLSYGWEHGEPAPDLPRICIFPGSRSPTGKGNLVVKSQSATRFPAVAGTGITQRSRPRASPKRRLRRSAMGYSPGEPVPAASACPPASCPMEN